jgi:hypothetical protein
MINFNDILTTIILEDVPNSQKSRKLTDAIKNRYPVSFYYNGPKGEVLPGRRIKAELVAMGLTKKGNLVVRGWVQSPSTSKKGFSEHGWRMFILSRMSNIQVYEDETFDVKRPNYKEGDDKSMSVTYVTSDWGTPSKSIRDVEPSTEPKQTKPTLPQPKPKEKPTVLPQPEIRRDIEVYDELKNKIEVVNNIKQVNPEDFKTAIDTLYKKKMEDWKNNQKEVGGNTIPGEGTRRRIEKDSEIEINTLMRNDNVKIGQTELQESIDRIKTLIFF